MRSLEISTNVVAAAGQQPKRWLWDMAALPQFRWPRAFRIVRYETGLKNFGATTLCPVAASDETGAVASRSNPRSMI
jgi:hypothetical protein